MLRYLTRKIFGLFALLIGVSVLTFSLTAFIEGNPAEIALRRAGVDPTFEEISLMEIQMGLDRSVPEQYLAWIGNALRLDFGLSHASQRPVGEELLHRLPATLQLAVGAFLLTLLLAIPIGTLAAMFHGRWPDKLISAITFPLMGIPGFVLGTLLIYFLSVRLGLLPMVGPLSPARYVLPVITLALPMACRYVRLIRAGLLDCLAEDYILLLRTQGLGESTIFFWSAFKNAAIPIVNLLGISFGTLLGGSIIVESIFSWPGLGSYLLASILGRDYPVIMAYVLLMGAVFVFIHSLVDLLTALLDPRISLDRSFERGGIR